MQKSSTLFHACIYILLSASLIANTGCLNSDQLAGGKTSNSGGLTGSFQGCITATAVNQNAIDVTYEWPTDSISMTVLRNGVPVYTSLTGAGTFTDYGLLEGVTYAYSCQATFIDATIKLGSNVISVHPLSINTPTFYGVQAVTVLTTSTALVTWIQATGVPTTKYKIVAKLNVDPSTDDFDETLTATQNLIASKQLIHSVISDSPSATSVTLSGLGDDLPYHFAVQACSAVPNCSVGDGTADYITKTTTDNGAPQTIGATSITRPASSYIITAPWDASLGEITTRQVWREQIALGAPCDTAIASFANVQNFDITDPTLTPTELTLTGVLAENSKYCFVVVDVDKHSAKRSSLLAPEIVSVTTGDLTPPQNFLGIRTDAAPTGLVSPAEGVVTVKWYAPSGNDWSDYSGFKVYRVEPYDEPSPTDANLVFVQDCVCANGYGCSDHKLSCSVSGLAAYRTYRFHVRAYDGSANVTNTSVVTKSANVRTLDETAPTFNSNLGGGAPLGYSSGAVNLFWNAITYENQYSSEPGVVVNYQIWRKVGASSFIDATNPNTDGVLLATQTTRTYDDAAVSDGITYNYTICALDTSLNRTCDGFVATKTLDDVTAPTVTSATDVANQLTNNKTTTGKSWDLSWKMSDNITLHDMLGASLYRKVSTVGAGDYATSGDTSLTIDVAADSVGAITYRLNEDSTAMTGISTTVVTYINYTLIVTDNAGNPTTVHHSVTLDNIIPADPTLSSFSTPSPNNSQPSPTIDVNIHGAATAILYSDVSCSTAITASSSFASPASLLAPFTANVLYSVYAKSVSASGTYSSCALIGTYHYDTSVPTIASVTIAKPLDGSSNPIESSPDWVVTYGAITMDAAVGGSSLGGAITYCIKLNSTTTAGCSWTSLSSLQSTYTVTGNASLAEGNNYVSVWVKDAALNVSARVQSNNLVWDHTAPVWAANQVTVPNWSTAQTLAISYTQSATDIGGSGVDHYEYSLGQGSASTSWTTTSSSPVNLAGLQEGIVYYFTIRVLDVYGNATAHTNTFQVDLTDPAAPTISSPAESASIVIASSSNNTSYTGTCDGTTSSVTTVVGGTGVTINSSSCTGGTNGTLAADITYANSSASRAVTITTTKPSGRSAVLVRTVNVTATPQVLGSAVTSTTASSTIHNINMPTGISSGDLLITFIVTSSGTNSNYTPTNASWTNLNLSSYANTQFGNFVLWRIAGASVPSTYNFTTITACTMVALTVRIAGHTVASPFDTITAGNINEQQSLYYVIMNGTVSFSTTTMTVSSIGGFSGGSIHVGDVVSMGGGTSAHVTAFGTGSGGTGTYTIDFSEPTLTNAQGVLSPQYHYAPSVTPSVNASLQLVANFRSGAYGTDTNVTTYPGGFTKINEASGRVSAAYKALTTNSATGTTAITRTKGAFAESSITLLVK